jgi:hypothetical protein
MLATKDLRPLRELSLSAFEIPTDGWWQRVQAIWTELMSPVRSLPRVTPLGWVERAQACSPLYHPPVGFAPGYYYTDGVTPPNFAARVVFDALNTAAQNDQVVRRNLQDLQQMTTELRRRGVTVVLLRLPHEPTYSTGLPAAATARWHQLKAWARTRQDVVVLDWGKRADFRPGDFVDIHHLNVFGADKLASLLDAQLRPLCETAR